MDLIKQTLAQLTEIWNRWNRPQQIGIVAVACLCIASVIAVGMWASTKEFVTLTNGLTPAAAHEVVSTLESSAIEYQLNFSGSAVSVPLNDVNRARLAIKELGHDIPPIDEETGVGLIPDPAQQRSRLQRSQERRLATSIAQMQSIRSATVHITQGEPSPFIRDRRPTKASVVLQLVPGAMFSGSDAMAIVSLVSHAVQDLDPENTIIIDTNGHILSGSDVAGTDVSGQLDYRRVLENSLSSKAEAMLIPLLGPNHAIVRVSANINFTDKTSAVKSYDPEAKVKSKELITTETTRADQRSGDTGTTSNVGSLSLQTQGGTLSDIETIDTEYKNTETIDTIHEAPGTVTRLTIAAVVELPEATPDETGSSVPAFTTEQIESIIKQAVGFDEARNDEIEVLAAPMTGLPDFTVPVGWASDLEQLAPLAGSISLGVASIIALILGTMMIRRLKPVVVQVERRDAMDPELRARIADISDEIRQHPDAVSTVLAGWLAEQNTTTTTETKQPQRKAA